MFTLLLVAVMLTIIAGPEHCVVLLGNTRDSHSSSFHPVVQVGTGECNAGGSPAID